MKNKQTAVEWLNQWHIDNPYGTPTEWRESFNKAKEMEKEQIVDSFKYGYNEGVIYITSYAYLKELTPEQYYNETYNK
tara:strand:+ start:615 stop:848 length:234 start_codon:yes stop_codon:yes gene_type:complete